MLSAVRICIGIARRGEKGAARDGRAQASGPWALASVVDPGSRRQRGGDRSAQTHALNEAEMLLSELPLELREQLPDTSAVRPRLAALARRRLRPNDPTVALRLRLLREHHRQITHLDREERAVCRELATLGKASGSNLDELC